MSLIVLNTPYAATVLGLLCGALLDTCHDGGAPDGERMFRVTPVPSVVRRAVRDAVVVTLVLFDTPVGATASCVISSSLQPASGCYGGYHRLRSTFTIGWRNYARMYQWAKLVLT